MFQHFVTEFGDRSLSRDRQKPAIGKSVGCFAKSQHFSGIFMRLLTRRTMIEARERARWNVYNVQPAYAKQYILEHRNGDAG
jgi:hypothetical protein